MNEHHADTVGYATHRGLVRGTNEDTAYVDPELGLFIVADGMGGHNAGELASAIAVERVSRHVTEGIEAGQLPLLVLQESILSAHETLLSISGAYPEYSEMGTTIVVALLTGNHFLISHVGDSRAYSVINGEIRSLTTDHSFVAELVKGGLISPEEARTHKARHGLTMALGALEQVEPVMCCLPWREPGCLLLCSDGLTDMLADEEICAVIREASSPGQACRNLIETANDRGGKDNVTAVLICRR